MSRLESVPASRWLEALRFVAGGDCRDAYVDAHASAMREMAASRPRGASRLWWSLDERDRCTAAALAVDYPGRVAFLFNSPPTAPGVNEADLVRLVNRISGTALGDGMAFVQAILQPTDIPSARMVEQAGFVLLADLIYMAKDLAAGQMVAAPPPDITWRCWRQYSQDELGELIMATYEQSLDCPRLSGVRHVSDIIEAHKASGVFHPQSWWIADRGGQAGGCILVNDSRDGYAQDVVYTGVHPRFRGHGLGAAMIRHAAGQARLRGMRTLSLAVDSRNTFAMRLYQQEGLYRTHERLAYAMIGIARAGEKPSPATVQNPC